MKIDNVETLLVEELRDLYDAEKQLVRALPKMARNSSDEELEQAFQQHLEQTREQVGRLERAFELLGERAKAKPCKGMKGLVEEGAEVMQEDAEETLGDSAIIGAAQKVEHYEIAGYGTARTLAQAIGRKDVAQLLQETLDEEGETDKRLTAIAKRLLKEQRGRVPAETGEREGGRSKGSRRGSSERAGSQARAAASSRGRSSAKGASARGRSAQRASGGSSARARGGRGSAGARGGGRMLTDHEEIQRWAEERGAQPACVRGTGGRGDTGMIRLDFPGYSGEQSLEPISWDQWFEKFDDSGLGLLVQEKTARGQKSNFNKLVSREKAMSAR